MEDKLVVSKCFVYSNICCSALHTSVVLPASVHARRPSSVSSVRSVRHHENVLQDAQTTWGSIHQLECQILPTGSTWGPEVRGQPSEPNSLFFCGGSFNVVAALPAVSSLAFTGKLLKSDVCDAARASCTNELFATCVLPR